VVEVSDPRGGKAVQIAVPTGRGQDRAGRIDRGTWHQALADRRGEIDAQPTRLADGRDTRVQRPPQVADGASRARRDGLQRQLGQVKLADPEEVAMAVPKTGHHGGCRDHDGVRRARSTGRRRAGVTDRGAVDHDDSVTNRVAATGDEQIGLDALHAGTVRRAHSPGKPPARKIPLGTPALSAA
jgi:hypothetical protein